MTGFCSAQKDQHQDLISVQAGSSRKGLNNASVLLLNETIILQSKLSGLSLLAEAWRRTWSHGKCNISQGQMGSWHLWAGLDVSCLQPREAPVHTGHFPQAWDPPERPGTRSFHPDHPGTLHTLAVPAEILSP